MRAIVIKSCGDPAIAGAISDGIHAVQLRAVQEECRRLQAVNGVRCEGDSRRWQRTQKRLARKYSTVPVGRVHGAILGAWALIWLWVFGVVDYLREWNRR